MNLEHYIENLQQKIADNKERYLDILDITSDGKMNLEHYIENLQQKIPANKERYVDILDITPDVKRIINIATMLNRNFKVAQLKGTAYETKLTEEQNATIKGWNDLLNNNVKLLNGQIPGTTYHTGSIAKETLYIKTYLEQITATGFLTLDSQPGLFINDTNIPFIQLPYLDIANTPDKINKLLQIIYMQYPNIYLVDYDITPIDISDFPNWNDENRYVSIVLGTTFPEMKLLTSDDIIQIVYIFADQFFKDIIEICRSL